MNNYYVNLNLIFTSLDDISRSSSNLSRSFLTSRIAFLKQRRGGRQMIRKSVTIWSEAMNSIKMKEYIF